MFRPTRRIVVVLGMVAALALPAGASATHSWEGYHWARTANPFTLKLGDNVSKAWDAYLGTTSSDWTESAVLNTTIVRGRAKPPIFCLPTAGRVEVCNAAYGVNGWLGVASIWITGGGHITQGTVKVNDTYFNTPQYNTPAWRNLVMCQEVGHTLGLDHQDVVFDNTNLGTCMDYTNDPDGGDGGASETDLSNEHPNTHDYDQLQTIYNTDLTTGGHLDSTTTVGQVTSSDGTGAAAGADWGRAVATSRDGRSSVYVRDLGAGARVVTFVIWAT